MGKTAFLVLDLQNGILARFQDQDPGYLARAKLAIDTARNAGVSIIYVQTSFRKGYPEVSSRNLMFKGIASSGAFIDGDDSVAIVSEVKPQEGDVVLTKRRVSAFSGSDLDVILRSLDVDSLVLCGVATSGAVLSTLRQAADLDYALKVVQDLCLDWDPEVHRVMNEKVFTRQAEVLTTDAWIKQLNASKQ